MWVPGSLKGWSMRDPDFRCTPPENIPSPLCFCLSVRRENILFPSSCTERHQAIARCVVIPLAVVPSCSKTKPSVWWLLIFVGNQFFNSNIFNMIFYFPFSKSSTRASGLVSLFNLFFLVLVRICSRSTQGPRKGAAEWMFSLRRADDWCLGSALSVWFGFGVAPKDTIE